MTDGGPRRGADERVTVCACERERAQATSRDHVDVPLRLHRETSEVGRLPAAAEHLEEHREGATTLGLRGLVGSPEGHGTLGHRGLGDCRRKRNCCQQALHGHMSVPL